MKSINPIQTFTASCIHRGKKVLQHFITLLNDEKVLILRAKHNLLIDWYTRSRLEKNLSITLVLTVWMCNLFKKYTVISTTSSLCKKVEITLYLKVSFLPQQSQNCLLGKIPKNETFMITKVIFCQHCEVYPFSFSSPWNRKFFNWDSNIFSSIFIGSPASFQKHSSFHSDAWSLAFALQIRRGIKLTSSHSGKWNEKENCIEKFQLLHT